MVSIETTTPGSKMGIRNQVDFVARILAILIAKDDKAKLDDKHIYGVQFNDLFGDECPNLIYKNQYYTKLGQIQPVTYY